MGGMPTATTDKASSFLRKGWDRDETTWTRSIRKWVRENMARP